MATIPADQDLGAVKTLEDARGVVVPLVDAMAPFCERIAIAGSLRRRVPQVRDIELVAIPRWWATHDDGSDLFNVSEEQNLLYGWAANQPLIQWIKPGVPQMIEWPLNPAGRYWRGYLREAEMKVDLFLCTPANWGVIFLIRTGSADFSHAVAAHARKRGTPFQGGYLRDGPTENAFQVITPEEEDVFKYLNLQWVEPEDRHDKRDVRPWVGPG